MLFSPLPPFPLNFPPIVFQIHPCLAVWGVNATFFELMCKKWEPITKAPELIDWTENQKKYKGWHLVYADQCPWHEKSVFALLNTALDYGIDLNVTKLNNANEAKEAPSGYGVFSLLHNGRLIEDHYLSATRFRNILKKELLQES